MKKPSYIQWLKDTGVRLNTVDEKMIEVWEFQHQKDDEILSEWATHFRNHYCLDSDIDELVSGTGKSKKQYLLDIKFPDEKNPPGPSIRSGDFSEILICDYLEYICNFWVPRLKYIDKAIRNESVKGVDIIGFKINDSKVFTPNDEMIVFEVKAAFTDTDKNKLQEAIDHSGKDEIRKGETLNALKQKFMDKKEKKNVEKIKRFQNIIDNPYIEKFGATGVVEKFVFDKTDFFQADTSQHIKNDLLFLLVVRGIDMMPLVHELYRRAADEA